MYNEMFMFNCKEKNPETVKLLCFLSHRNTNSHLIGIQELYLNILYTNYTFEFYKLNFEN